MTLEGILKDFMVYKLFTSRSPEVFKTCYFTGLVLELYR